MSALSSSTIVGVSEYNFCRAQLVVSVIALFCGGCLLFRICFVFVFVVGFVFFMTFVFIHLTGLVQTVGVAILFVSLL